ncbi:MAG: helix-turn-helix domain-containing protein [Acidobacteriota bacterium]
MEAKGKDLKSKEVAHILDCSPDEVIDMARKGTLKALKEGRYWRVREADVW